MNEVSPATENPAPTEGAKVVSLSISAAERVKQLLEMEGNPDLKLRISIVGGGCSGFSYKFDLDDKTTEDDLFFTYHGVTIVCDETSLDFVAGSELDYVEDLMGASFRMTNPNATASCGCGSSFSV